MKEKKTTWQDFEPPVSIPFRGSTRAEVLIIGGGITGIATAYQLAKQGKRVVVIEKQTLDQTVTAYTTAFLTCSLDTNFSKLEQLYGAADTAEIVGSHLTAIETIETAIREHAIDCDFKRVSNYIIAKTEQQFRTIEKDAKVLEQLHIAHTFHRVNLFPFPTYGILEIQNQARFHPLKYCTGLRQAASSLGAEFFEYTEALRIEGSGPFAVSVTDGSIIADSIVICTYNPFAQPAFFRLKKGMYVSYVYEASIPHSTLPEGIYEDDENPYHYFRIDSGSYGRDRLIIGGEDHRKSLPVGQKISFDALEGFLKTKLGIFDYKIERAWVGSILESSDGIALIGSFAPGKYVATAFSGNGMTYAHIAARLITDLIFGKENVLKKIYDPLRPLRFRRLIYKARDYTAEFFNGAVKNFLNRYLGNKK